MPTSHITLQGNSTVGSQELSQSFKGVTNPACLDVRTLTLLEYGLGEHQGSREAIGATRGPRN